MSEEVKMPKLRMAYKHVSGKIYVVWGMASHFIDKNHKEDNPIVIMASLGDGEPLYYPLSNFFDKNPTTGEERFQMVTPT